MILYLNHAVAQETPKLHSTKKGEQMYYQQENVRFYLDTSNLVKLKDYISPGTIHLRILYDSLHYVNCKELVKNSKTKNSDSRKLNVLYYKGFKGNSIFLKRIESIEQVNDIITLTLVFDNPCYIDGNYTIGEIKLLKLSDDKYKLQSIIYKGNWL